VFWVLAKGPISHTHPDDCEKTRNGAWIIPMEDGKPRLTVLVVDDEALLRWSLAEVLRRSGHTVIEATSAREALDAIGQSTASIDAVLLDYRLPDSTDLRLLEDVRHRIPRGAVVVMTAHGTPEMVQGALDRGAYCVLSKPFDMHTIPSVVADAYRAAGHHSLSGDT
jgi:DNA-binding NtrC family response regulator